MTSVVVLLVMSGSVLPITVVVALIVAKQRAGDLVLGVLKPEAAAVTGTTTVALPAPPTSGRNRIGRAWS